MRNHTSVNGLWLSFAIMWRIRGGDLIVISHKCLLILAPRPSMDYLHKTFPGTRDKICYCVKFQSSSCLISWLLKPRHCGLANWESTFFSKNLALLHFSSKVLKPYTWLTHPKQLCSMPHMSLVSWKGLWCSWQSGNNQTDLCETTRSSSPLYSYFKNIIQSIIIKTANIPQKI